MNFARKARAALFVSLFFVTNLSLAATEKIRLGSGENSVQKTERFDKRSDSKRISVSFHLRELQLEGKKNGFQELSLPGVNSTSDLGDPRLPFHAVTIHAGLGDVQVKTRLGQAVAIEAGKLFPAQKEACRCPDLDQQTSAFVDNVAGYKSPETFYRLESLGDFRGTPVSRLILLPHRYDPKKGMLYLYPDAEFEISYQYQAREEAPRAYDYLVISPREQLSTLEPWLAHKRAQGLSFHVQAYEDMNVNSADSLKAWIHAEYGRAHFRYSLIVGGENRIPQARVSTTTDSRTPSDLPYYAMGGASDIIPEVLSGRVVADDNATLARVLQKWMAYESGQGDAAGWNNAIGIASNEGSNPSDAEYVLSIQNKLNEQYGARSVYFHQNASDSNPNGFNAAMNSGSMWVTYLGHGSGTDWPSFGSNYGVSHISQMRNASAVKPVWIDVACLNGILRPANAGAHLMGDADPSGAPIGTAAYLGGTVLISWHPPAIFARGVAYSLAATPSPVLGEVLQAGQKYLSENHSGANDIASNQRWYHLQGDPSMRLRLR